MKRMKGRRGRMGVERKETRFGGSRAGWDRDRGGGHCWDLRLRVSVWLHWHPRASPWCQLRIEILAKLNCKIFVVVIEKLWS